MGGNTNLTVTAYMLNWESDRRLVCKWYAGLELASLFLQKLRQLKLWSRHTKRRLDRCLLHDSWLLPITEMPRQSALHRLYAAATLRDDNNSCLLLCLYVVIVFVVIAVLFFSRRIIRSIIMLTLGIVLYVVWLKWLVFLIFLPVSTTSIYHDMFGLQK